jgi:predicted dehydrogenase
VKTIRWGIIGCGNVTEVKSGPGFQNAENSALVAVMRRNIDLARDYATRHNVPKWYGTADEIINDPEVDAVYVATPPASHKEYAIKSLQAGKPVYVEKPMACSYQECMDMTEASKKAGVPLYVAYYRRGLDRFNKIKELIDTGAIGDVRFVTATLYQDPDTNEMDGSNLPWRVIPEISGGGKFLDLASHTLDIFDYILGPICEAGGHAANQANLYTAEDIVTVSLSFSSGIKGIGVWCFTAYEKHDMNEIIGSRGKISFSTFGQEPILLINQDGIKHFPIENPVHIQQQLIQSIVNELNGCGVCSSTGISAARTSWVMDEVLRDYRHKKGWDIK